MTPQGLYDKAREWAKEDSGNAYVILTLHGKGITDGEVNGSPIGIAWMLREVMRRDINVRVVAKMVLHDLAEHPEDCIGTNGKEGGR